MTISKTPSKNASVRIISWVVFLSYSVFVFRSSIAPFDSIPSFFLHINDKTLHAFFYFLLFWATLWGFKNAMWFALRNFSANLSLVYCAVMGAATEIAQMNVQGRSCDPADWASDVVGATIGLFIYAGFKKGKEV